MRKFEGYQKGINLGGWLSQYNDTTKEYYDTFITEADIRTIASWGLDHVRVPVDHLMLEDEDGNPIEKGFFYLDQCIEWCKAARLSMVLDMHDTHGYTFDPLVKNIDREAFFRDPDLQEHFYRLWERIAERYAKDRGMLAFELLNEVVSPAIAEEWNEIAEQAIKRLRVLAPESYIIVGGTRYNNVISVPELRKPYDDHVVYNFHCYEPMIFTHQSAYWVEGMPQDFVLEYPGELQDYRTKAHSLTEVLGGAIDIPSLTSIGPDFFEILFAPALKAAEENNAPLYCGEYGVIDRAPLNSVVNWYRDIHGIFEKYGIGRAAWNYKEKDFGISGAHYDPVREELIRQL